MRAHGRFGGSLFAMTGAGVMLAALAGCSSGSSQGSATAATPAAASSGASAAAPVSGPAPASSGAAVSASASAATGAPPVLKKQAGVGDQKVTAVFQPQRPVSDTVFTALVGLVRLRAAAIPGTVVTVTGASGSITVVGDTAQQAAIGDLGRALVVSFRPVVFAAGPGGPAMPPAPSAAGEASAEDQFGTVSCADPATLPAPAGPAEFGVGCSADGGTEYLLGAAGATGPDVQAATAENGQAGWEVDVTFDAPGSARIATLTGAIAASGGSMAVVWDDTVASVATVRTPITGGAMTLSGLDQDQARLLAGMLDIGALNVTLNPSSISVVH